MISSTTPSAPIPVVRLALAVAAVIGGILLLPTCESARKGSLSEPLELFLLSEQRSEATPVPYTDETGAINGFVSTEPDLVIHRVRELIVETRYLPILSGGQVKGRQPHRYAHLHLHRRDRKRLAEFSERAVNRVLLARMGGAPLSTTFVTEPMEGDTFVISGPENEEILASVQRIQMSLDHKLPGPFAKEQK